MNPIEWLFSVLPDLPLTTYLILLLTLIISTAFLLKTRLSNKNAKNNTQKTSRKSSRRRSSRTRHSDHQSPSESEDDHKKTYDSAVRNSQIPELATFSSESVNSDNKNPFSTESTSEESETDENGDFQRNGLLSSGLRSPRMSSVALDTLADAATMLTRPVKNAASAVLPDFATPTHSRSGRRLRRRERALILARKMMNVEREPIQVEQKAAPEQFLEPDVYESTDSMLPPELSALYKTVRIFGHFEKPVFFNLCKHMKTIELREGEYLFRRGDHDEFIHVVQEGQVDVFIRENVLAHNVPVYSKDLENPIYSYDQDKKHLGNECRVAEVTSGESIHSLLSVLDVLTGHSAPYKTVSARAVKHTKVLRLPVKVMKDEFEHNPDALIRLVQIIAMRLQRVTMFALHNYLGLTHELINAQVDEFTEDFKSFKISKVKDVLKNAKKDASSGNLRDHESGVHNRESLHPGGFKLENAPYFHYLFEIL